jgi:hypothetical protein
VIGLLKKAKKVYQKTMMRGLNCSKNYSKSIQISKKRCKKKNNKSNQLEKANINMPRKAIPWIENTI